MEGKSMLHLQDSRCKYVFRDMIKIVQQTDEGFYQHHCRKDEREIYDSRKLSFVKHIKPLNCFIGTALYVEDIEKEIENTLLSTISRIQFGKKGYIFVHGFNGDILVDSGRRFSGTKKLWELFTKNLEKMKSLFAREHTAALAPNGEFIYYTFEKSSSLNITSPKTSFIYGIPELQWLIGAEFYLDEVDTKIAVMQAELSRQIIKKVLCFSLITLGILAFALILFQRSHKKLRKDIDAFIASSNQLLYSSKPINRDQFESYELDQIAQKFNKIFKDKTQIQQKLLHEETALLQSEEKYKNTMDSTLFGVCIIQDLVFQYVNPAFASMFGYTPDEMEALKQSLLQRAAGETGTPYDIKCVRRNGELFDAMVLGAATKHKEKPASVGTMLDLTNRKAAETKLQNIEKRANALLESIPDMVFRVNGQGIFIDFKADHKWFLVVFAKLA